MKYLAMRQVALNGDVLMVEGRGLFSTLIRVLTGQQISHVALLVWIDTTLWVAEMKEGIGYRLQPASLWVEDVLASGATLYYGTAPEQVLKRPADVRVEVLKHRQESYSYWSLLPVWWAQITRRQITAGLVCSTFVQRIWEKTEYRFSQTADPGDFLRLCGPVMALEADDA